MIQTSAQLVSVIITTKNSATTLNKCLLSVKNQTYPHTEIILVDNNSTDNSKEIARKYTNYVYNKGPERSAQRNFAIKKSKGKYIYIIDSDFVLEPNVITECVSKIKKGFDAVIVHNTPDVSVSWIAKLRKFETDMYKYNLDHSAARFFKKKIFQNINGYNEKITAGEDYDIQNKLNKKGYKTGFIDSEAIHLGEPKHFFKHMQKYYLYGKDFNNYKKYNSSESKTQLKFIRPVYLKNWKSFLKHPFFAITFIFYHICKFTFGGIGYVIGKTKMKT